MQGGTTGPSPQPLGQVPPSSQFQQMGGSNVPLNPSTSYGQGNAQYQEAPELGPFIPNFPYQQPIVGAGNFPLNATPQGGSNPQFGWNQPGGIYAPGEPKISVMSLSQEDSTPPNKVGIPLLTPTNQGDTTSFLAKWAQIPNRGCINSQTSFTPECLRVVLGCMAPNIPILKIPRTHLRLRSSHFWQLLSFPTCLN